MGREGEERTWQTWTSLPTNSSLHTCTHTHNRAHFTRLVQQCLGEGTSRGGERDIQPRTAQAASRRGRFALGAMPSVVVEQRRLFKVALQRQLRDGKREAAAYEVCITVRGLQRLSDGDLAAVMTAAVSSAGTDNPEHPQWERRQISSYSSTGGKGKGEGGGGEGGGGTWGRSGEGGEPDGSSISSSSTSTSSNSSRRDSSSSSEAGQGNGHQGSGSNSDNEGNDGDRVHQPSILLPRTHANPSPPCSPLLPSTNVKDEKTPRAHKIRRSCVFCTASKVRCDAGLPW